MSASPNTSRQSAEILLQGAADFVDTTNLLMTQQQLGLQAIQYLWPERYEESKELFIEVMKGHAEVLSEVL